MNIKDKRAKRAEYMRNYYHKNKDRVMVINKKWRDKNKEKVKRYLKRYEIENKELLAIKRKEWRDKNKDKIKSYYENYCKSRPLSKPPQEYVCGSRNTKYIRIYDPDHPFSDKRGRVPLHRIIMESHIGRFIKDNEVVHHLDGNGLNNNINNLKLLTKKEHSILHCPGRNPANGRFVSKI